MVIFEKKIKDKIRSKYNLKRTKLHCFEKIFSGEHAPEPL